MYLKREECGHRWHVSQDAGSAFRRYAASDVKPELFAPHGDDFAGHVDPVFFLTGGARPAVQAVATVGDVLQHQRLLTRRAVHGEPKDFSIGQVRRTAGGAGSIGLGAVPFSTFHR